TFNSSDVEQGGPAKISLARTAIDVQLTGLNLADSTFTGYDVIPFALNAADPTRLMTGYLGLSEDDSGALPAPLPGGDGLAGDVVHDLSSPPNQTFNLPNGAHVTAIAYGGFNGTTPVPEIAIVGDSKGDLFFRGAGSTILTQFTKLDVDA